jgi:hypothetical protein
MPSTFTWLDYSEKDRQRVQRVIDSIRDHDTRDELGIGTVRDALSDLLFPGTTTIQTRPKYFLLVPWIFQALERWAGWEQRSLNELRRDGRRREIELLTQLMNAEDKDGVIGREAGKSLQRLPSSIYWNGLAVLGIRVFPGSVTQLERVLSQGQVGRLAAQVEGDEAPVDGDGFWHAGIPALPRGFPQGQTLELSSEEALYLKDRILSRASGTLLAWLVARGDFGEGAEAPWEHPLEGELPSRLARQLEHARVFSELMHGAAVLYNLMLAEKAHNAERIDQHGENLAWWAGQVVARRVLLEAWNREDFWKTVRDVNSRVPVSTQSFVESWMDLALGSGDPSGLRDSKAARTLIQDRELRLKGPRRARMFEPRALELWSGDAGTRRLVYRWNIVQDIVRDISAGLNEGRADA